MANSKRRRVEVTEASGIAEQVIALHRNPRRPRTLRPRRTCRPLRQPAGSSTPPPRPHRLRSAAPAAALALRRRPRGRPGSAPPPPRPPWLRAAAPTAALATCRRPRGRLGYVPPPPRPPWSRAASATCRRPRGRLGHVPPPPWRRVAIASSQKEYSLRACAAAASQPIHSPLEMTPPAIPADPGVSVCRVPCALPAVPLARACTPH